MINLKQNYKFMKKSIFWQAPRSESAKSLVCRKAIANFLPVYLIFKRSC